MAGTHHDYFLILLSVIFFVISEINIKSANAFTKNKPTNNLLNL